MTNHRKLPIPKNWPGGETYFAHQLRNCRAILPSVVGDESIGDPVGGFNDAMLHLELAKNLALACDETLNSIYWGGATAAHRRRVWRSVLNVYAIIFTELEAFYEWFNPWWDYLMEHPKFCGSIGVILFNAEKCMSFDLPASKGEHSRALQLIQYTDSKVLLASLSGLRRRAEQFQKYSAQLKQFPASTD